MTALWLSLQAITFALWAFSAFRILFYLRRQADIATGQTFPGPLTFLRTLRAWAHDPAERSWRLRLAILTLVLIGLSAGFTLVANA